MYQSNMGNKAALCGERRVGRPQVGVVYYTHTHTHIKAPAVIRPRRGLTVKPCTCFILVLAVTCYVSIAAAVLMQ